MDDLLRVRLAIRLWSLRCCPLGRRRRRAAAALALPLLLLACLPLSWAPVASDFQVQSLSLPGSPALLGVAIDPVLGRAYFADRGGVWALDETDGRLLGRTDVLTRGVGSPGGAMAVDAVRHRVYLATLRGHLAAVDGRSGVVAPLPPQGPALALALDGIGDRLLVPQPFEKALLALDVRSQRVVARVRLADPPMVVAVDDLARRVYVAAAGAARLEILDADTYRSLATVALPGPADALAVDAKIHRVYAATAAGATVAALDGQSGVTLATLQVGRSAVALAQNPTTGHLFVVDADAGNVVVVDTRRNAILATIPVAGQPAAVAVDAQTGFVAVASSARAGPAALPNARTVTVLRDGSNRPTLLAALLTCQLGDTTSTVESETVREFVNLRVGPPSGRAYDPARNWLCRAFRYELHEFTWR